MADEVFGPYRIEGAIGEGGMGTVHRAIDTRTGREVALKRLHRALTDPKTAKRFLREAKAARRLDHPNVVTIVDDGEIDGCFYLAMELVGGPRLRDLLRRPLPLERLAALAVGTGSALAAAHGLDILHRDIKPANLLLRGPLSTPLDVTVCDFGLAKLLDEAGSADPTTHEGAVLGTPAYMAPELATGAGATDARTDIYALGVLLFEGATGRRPFVGATPLALMMQHATEDPPDLRVLAPQLPPQLAELIGACLGKLPEHRPSSAQAVVDAFAPYLSAGARVPAPPAPLPQAAFDGVGVTIETSGHGAWESSRPKRSRRGARLGGALLGAAGLVGAAYLAQNILSKPVVAPVVALESNPTPGWDAGLAVTEAPALHASAEVESPTPDAGLAARPKPRRVSRRRPRRRASTTLRPDAGTTPNAEEPAEAPDQNPARSSVGPAAKLPAATDGSASKAPAPQDAGALQARAADSGVSRGIEPAPEAPPPEKARLRRVVVSGGASRGRIETVLGRRGGTLAACVRDEISQVEARFRIGFSGRAEAVKTEAGASTEACLDRALEGLRFPRPDTGSTEVRFWLGRSEKD